MLRTVELERLDLNVLAMYCLRVIDSNDPDSPKVEQARQLKSEWAVFIGHLKPPIPGLNSQQDIEAYRTELKQRMVTFLSGCSLNALPATPPSHSNARGAAAGRAK